MLDSAGATRHISAMTTEQPFDWFGEPEPRDPARAIRADMKIALPRRFYREAGVREEEGAYALVLDGKPARTPAKRPLRVSDRRAADALAAEWQAQGGEIDPSTMPLTRLVNSAIDGVAQRMREVAEETARYAGSDLLCYRAGDPERLVRLQSETWDPVLAWVRDELGARFLLVEGVMFAEQPPQALAAVRAAVDRVTDPLGLAALSTVTSLTGSVLLALAVAHGRLTAAEAWAAAHLDEDFQMEVWGQDAEALERRLRRWAEMEAAALALETAARA
jgi:chaperone required for assembly of F1-ATPase